MHVAVRPSIAAGAALMGGSAVVAAIAGPLLSAPEMRSPAVQLTAGDDALLTSVIDAFNETSTSATKLADNFFLAPFAGVQQAIVNQFEYAQELLNGTSFQDVLAEMSASQQLVQSGLTLFDASDSTVRTVVSSTLDRAHADLFQYLAAGAPVLVNTPDLPDLLAPLTDNQQQILDFLASPASAILIGALGPVVSPVVEFFNDIDAITTALGADDVSAATNELLALPANVIGAFFNGATLDLSSLVPAVNDSGLLADGVSLNALSLAFGGLFTAGSVQNFWLGADAFRLDPDSEFHFALNPIFAAGGSVLNSLGFQLLAPEGTAPIDVAGEGIGPLGASVALEQIVGRLLGDQWLAFSDLIPTSDGKLSLLTGRAGNPLEHLTFPSIGDTDSTPITAAAAGGVDVFGGLDENMADMLSGFNDLGAQLSADATAWLTSVTDLSQEYLEGLLALF